MTSTNTGHGNNGQVCATKGFQGPGLPGTPYAWSVAASSTSTTPFPRAQVEAALEWGEDQCEQEIDVQLDAYRGDKCQGHILAVVWPQHNLMKFTRPGGVWREMKPEYTEWTKWSECLDSPEDLQASTTPEICYGQRTRTRTKIIKRQNICEDRVEVVSKTTETETEKCEIKCPCIETWSEWREGEETCGEWSECLVQPHNSSDFDSPEEIAAFDGLTQSCRVECHRSQQCYVELTRTQTCTGKTETKIGREHTHTEECECPKPEPRLCYYNVNSNLGPHIQRITCERKMGGSPLAAGQWGRWPDGPPSDHCMFTVPGIFDDRFRMFQLTPGQSDPLCNKY